MRRTTILVILIILAFVQGCKKEVLTSQPPVITFIDAQFSVDKSASIVRFEFFDANGDLGLKQEENQGEQQYNIFVDYYEKENGNWVLKTPKIGGETTMMYRMPFIENEDGSSLTGETQLYLLYNKLIEPVADTFRYEIYIKDRALQQSNTIVTKELIVS